MVIKIATTVIVALFLFLGYVSTRDGKFRYERSGVIQAPAEKIFPYISQFKLGQEWSPYAKKDPKMNWMIVGTDGQAGAIMEFEGNSEVGSGKLETLKVVPNESVDIKLTMLKPFEGENFIQYKLTPEKEGTRFTWTMSGESGFLGKLISVIIDCDKMIGDQFTEGISNLKTVVEAKN